MGIVHLSKDQIMPWKEVTRMCERRRFIEAYLTGEHKMSLLCKEFGISRKTGYKLINKFKSHGNDGFKDLPRKPLTSPNKTADCDEALILRIRDSHPAWGGVKIKSYLETKGYAGLPSTKTINRILKRYGRICAEESEKHTAWKRFEHENPNDLWQMDFKGHFALNNGMRCHPLTLLDDHSRFNLNLESCANETRNTVQQSLIRVFRTYGLPEAMTMDNGAPWGYSGDQLHTQLTAWLIRLGINVRHSRPCHPQTQGKLERFHRTLKLELLSRYSFNDLEHAQQGFDYWRRIYNEERPHEAIQLGVPKNKYTRSCREYPESLPGVEYDEKFEVRKVQYHGEIYYKNKAYRIGRAFHGEKIGLQKTDDENMMAAYYCHQKLLEFDIRYPFK